MMSKVFYDEIPEKKYIIDREASKKMTGYASVDKPWLKWYPEYITTSSLPYMTLYDYLKKSNEQHAYRPAINYFDQKITYKEMLDKIDITARSFIALGVKKGDIVTISMPTTPEFIYMFYALSKIGATANTIDPRKSPEEMKEYAELVKSKIFVIIDSAANKIKDIKEKTTVEKIVAVSPAESFSQPLKLAYKVKELTTLLKNNYKKFTNSDACISWEEFYNYGLQREKQNIIEEFPEYEYDRPVAIVYTGGTTGKSKGVVLSNDNINAAAYQCQTSGYDFQPQHKWLNIMPPFIAYGVGNGLHLPLVCNMEVIVIPQFNPNQFDRLLEKYHPNHMTGVPTHYDNLVHSKRIKGLNYLYSAIVGGDKMDETLEVIVNEYFEKHDCNYNVSKGYGMSEVTAAVCATSRKDLNKLGSVGVPFHHTIMAIFDPETKKELKYNEIGEVCITGPNTMVGYFNNEEETNNIIKTHEDGKKWVHSGDLGYITEDGLVYIIGRIKELIIRHDGFKVFPILIEEVISSHPAVQACKVVGIKDNDHSQGELPKVHLVLKEEYRDSAEQIEKELKNLCEEKLAEYLQPVGYTFRDSLPKTPIGKIDFLRLQFEDQGKVVNLQNTKNRSNDKVTTSIFKKK